MRHIKLLAGFLAGIVACSPLTVFASEDMFVELTGDIGDESGDKDVVYIDDITAEMASNAALNHALRMGEKGLSTGIAVKYCDGNGAMVGWMVPYVKDGEPYGYVLFDFREEDPVSEFAIEQGVYFTNDSEAATVSDDMVIVEGDIWDYQYHDVSEFVQPHSFISNGRYVFTSMNDYETNFYQVGLKPGETVLNQVFLKNAYSPEVTYSSAYVCSKWKRYACPCVVALSIVEQNGLTAGYDEDYIYRWFWDEMNCCPSDDWDEDFNVLWSRLNIAVSTSKYTSEFDYDGDGEKEPVLVGGCSETVMRDAIVKWCIEKAEKRTASTVQGYSIYENVFANGIAGNCPTFLCFSIKFEDDPSTPEIEPVDNKTSTHHAVNVVGYVKAKKAPDSTLGDVIYAVVANGYVNGYRYINFSHTKWDPAYYSDGTGKLGYIYACYIRRVNR